MNDPARPVTLVRVIDTATSRWELRSDGVIVQRVTGRQNLAQAKDNIAAFERLAAGQRRPALVDNRREHTTERGVREYLLSPEALRWCAAIALLTESAAGRVISNILIALKSPDMPARVFTDEAAALAWLERVAPAATPPPDVP